MRVCTIMWQTTCEKPYYLLLKTSRYNSITKYYISRVTAHQCWSLKQSGGSEKRKAREKVKKKKNDNSTSARTSVMAPLHLALHDLLLKYRLWGFPSLKIVPAKFYTSLNYFDSEGRFFFVCFPANTGTFTSPFTAYCMDRVPEKRP